MAQGVIPFTESGLEFELMIEHQIAYPALPPIDSGTASIDLFTQPEAFDRMDDLWDNVSPWCSIKVSSLNYH